MSNLVALLQDSLVLWTLGVVTFLGLAALPWSQTALTRERLAWIRWGGAVRTLVRPVDLPEIHWSASDVTVG